MIRASKINVYVRLMKNLGFGPKQLLANTDIDARVLSTAEALIPRQSYYAVIMNMIKLTGNPGIAFSLGEMIEVSDFGILGYAMLSSVDLGQVIRIRRQYHNSMFGTMISINAAEDARPGYELTVASIALTETLRRFEIEEFLVEGVSLVKKLTGIDPLIRCVSFTHAKPAHSALYKSFFKCPIKFSAPDNVFSVKKPNFSTPILSGNSELHNVCARHCQEVLQTAHDAGPVQSRLRELFLTNPGNLPDVNSAASHMGISERNLRRKLEAEGLTFQGMKDEFRLDLSHQLLVSGRMAPKEVAYLLGYATPSAFSRAFKAWTGQTIQQYLHVDART